MSAKLLAAGGAALLLAGFFEPWFAGTAEFAARDFSGFDLARLVRNFEIASSSDEAGRLRAAAAVLYLVPALGINACVFAWFPMPAPTAALVVGASSLYAAFVLLTVALLSAASITELAPVLGGPQRGFWLSLAGAGLLGMSAAFTLEWNWSRLVRYFLPPERGR